MKDQREIRVKLLSLDDDVCPNAASSCSVKAPICGEAQIYGSHLFSESVVALDKYICQVSWFMQIFQIGLADMWLFGLLSTEN